MPRKPTGRPNGRPPKPFDVGKFEACCKLGATLEEVCGVLELSEPVLEGKIKSHYGVDIVALA